MKITHLLVGLGNPGRGYSKTRHNIGFMVIDEIASQYESMRRFHALSHIGTCLKVRAGQGIIAAKPLTFMNRSGDAVSDLLNQFRVPLDNLLIIVDDLALPFGKIRLRKKGSAGGHNGLKSIIERLGGDSFPRLRIGIGQNGNTNIEDTVDFVLSKFDKDERKRLPGIIEHSADACASFVKIGIENTMNGYN